MTTQSDFLRRIAEKLRQADISFMVTGSLGSAHYGEPRSTNDIDFVIDPNHEQLDRLVRRTADENIPPTGNTLPLAGGSGSQARGGSIRATE